jgi:hypothetical protein
MTELIGYIAGALSGFFLGSILMLGHMEEKQHVEKAGCEYVEQAPCKIIYIKEEK